MILSDCARRRAATSLLFLLGTTLCLGGSASADVIQSFQNGDWSDANTWRNTMNQPEVPDADDEAVILVGHTIFVDVGNIVVNALDVAGRLEGGAPNISGSARFVIVQPTGVIQSLGDGANISFVYSAADGFFRNNGDIKAASGQNGGQVNILYTHGTAHNNQFIRGGDGSADGGSVMLLAANVNNGDPSQGGLGHIRGGNGGTGPGGAAMMANLAVSTGTATNWADSLIRGGDSQDAKGGRASLQSAGPCINQGVAGDCGVGDAAVIGGTGMPGGDAIVHGHPEIGRGCVMGGETARDDPPNGTLTDGYTIRADTIELVAGESLAIGNLASNNAIQATDSIEITLASGGVLDLSNNSISTNWTAGTSILIRADNILLPAGLGLSDLMSAPAISVEPGASYTRLIALPDRFRPVFAGQNVELIFAVSSFSNRHEVVDYQISDTGGWLPAPIQVSDVALPPVQGVVITVPVEVPVGGSLESTFTMSASTQVPGDPADQVSSEIRLSIRPHPGTAVPAVPPWGLAFLVTSIIAGGILSLYRRA